jgi:hypothetical protein
MRRRELEADVLRELRRYLPGLWEVNDGADHGGRDSAPPDLLLSRNEGAGAILVEFMPTVRIRDLLGRLALHMVQWGPTRRDGMQVAFVIAAPRIGRRAVNQVEQFVSESAPEMEWGLVDSHGTVRLRMPSLSLDTDFYEVPVRGEAPSRHGRRLFSDLNRWMLKILLLRNAPREQWGGPRDKAGTPTELHRIADVSPETAHRFVRTFEEHDYLRRTKKGLKLVRVEALLESWMAAERLSPPRRIPASWLLANGPNLDRAFSPTPNSQVAVGGFEACGRHGMLHTPSSRLEVHVQGNWRQDAQDWEIEVDGVDEPDLFLLESQYPKSVGPGCVDYPDLPTVDIIQAALDVVHSSARGTEQAQLIMTNVLSYAGRDER